MDRAEEIHLLKQAQQGNEEAFAMLYRANVQTIFRYVYHRVGDVQTAEDLTGDVFVRAVRSLDAYTDQGRPFVAWLYRIANARVVDHYRRQGRRPDVSDIDAQPIPVEHDMDAGMLRSQASAALKAAMQQLTPEQQHVILLRFVEGRRIEQVAELVGKTPNAVKAMQHRALRALAKRLIEAGFEPGAVMAGLS